MAHADISYEEPAEAQESGNPDPIKMFKSLFSGSGGNGGGRSAAHAKKTDAPLPDDDIEAAAEAKPAASADAAPQQDVSVLDSVGLKPSNALRVMQQRYTDMTDEEKARAQEHLARMQQQFEQKLASMPAEQRAALQHKHELMQKAAMAQMHEDTLRKAVAAGELQPKLLPLAQQKLQQHLLEPRQDNGDNIYDDENAAGGEGAQLLPGRFAPRPPPGPPPETAEETRDRELLFAVRSGQPEELAALFKTHGADANAHVRAPADAEAHPLLHWAALNDQKEVLAFLIEQGADVDQRNPRQEVALHWAALNGNLRAVHLLVEAGCDRLASDTRGYSAMHHAAQFGRTVVLACLQRHGLSVDVRDSNGRTPLHWAAYKGEERTAQWLLDHGADVLAEDFEQCLPLHWAALQGYKNMSALLLANGAFPAALTRKDRTGGTPAHLAREKQAKYDAKSREARAFARVADYLEACAKQQREVSKYGHVTRHPTWFAWPVLAPLGLYAYYTVVMPETAYLYPVATVLFCFFYVAEWVAWTRLQLMNPGTYVLRHVSGSRHRLHPGVNGSDGGGGGGGGDHRGKDVRVAVSTVDDELCAHPVNPAQRNAQLYRELYLEALDRGLLVPVCTTCEIVKPVRSKHDRFTDTCVAKFDHYCPFMGVAVGQRNYTMFYFAMFNAFVCMWAWLYLVVMYTWGLRPQDGFWTGFYASLGFQAFAWLYLPIALYATLMVGQHALFIRRNLSTNEVMNRFRLQYLRNRQNPFNRGLVGNVLEFLGVTDPLEMDFRQYYAMEFEGRSHQVEQNNAKMRGVAPPDAPPSAEHDLGKRACHGHSHAGAGGGHGHSH